MGSDPTTRRSARDVRRRPASPGDAVVAHPGAVGHRTGGADPRRWGRARRPRFVGGADPDSPWAAGRRARVVDMDKGRQSRPARHTALREPHRPAALRAGVLVHPLIIPPARRRDHMSQQARPREPGSSCPGGLDDLRLGLSISLPRDMRHPRPQGLRKTMPSLTTARALPLGRSGVGLTADDDDAPDRASVLAPVLSHNTNVAV